MRIVTFGEGMIEITGHVGSTGRIAYGGDVLNMTIALARLGLSPKFMTALGVDPWSDELISAWEAEGVDCSLIARHLDRVPGLYGIRVDENGERSFTYWRTTSAASDFFSLPQYAAYLEKAANADLLFLSGITLSLFDAKERQKIEGVADLVRRRGGMVAFDGNFRPRGWLSAHTARSAFRDFVKHVTIVLPTVEDEILMFGEAETVRDIADRYHSLGVGEVVVKLGADGAFVSAKNVSAFVPTTPISPVDTSGAGDAFNAAYLSARISGLEPLAAAQFGHRLAGETICHAGAIPPRGSVEHIQL